MGEKHLRFLPSSQRVLAAKPLFVKQTRALHPPNASHHQQLSTSRHKGATVSTPLFPQEPEPSATAQKGLNPTLSLLPLSSGASWQTEGLLNKPRHAPMQISSSEELIRESLNPIQTREGTEPAVTSPKTARVIFNPQRGTKNFTPFSFMISDHECVTQQSTATHDGRYSVLR